MSEKVFNNAVDLDQYPFEDWRRKYVGPGYRSVCYLTESGKGKIVFFGYDLAGNPKVFICTHRSWIKYVVKYDTEEKDVYDRYVATKWFDSSYARHKYVEASDGLTVVECLRPEQEFLHRLFDDVVLDDSFNKQVIRIHSLDIETEVSAQFMKPSVADNRINMITVHDSLTDKFYTWSLGHAEVDFKEEPLKDNPKDKFEFFEFFDDEYRMLEHFLNWFDDNRPDVIYGWNIKGYDIPYLYTRLGKVLSKSDANRLSPIGKCFVKAVNHDNARADVAAEIEVSIDGLFVSDGLILYRDKFKVAGSSLDGGYSLDNVGEHEELGHKIQYSGSLKDLYQKDYQKFYEYNVRDVDLCKRIDDKCKLTTLARQISGFGLCNYDTIYSSISYLVGSVLSFAKTQMGGRVFVSYLAQRQDFDGFEGAFVFPCEPAVYRDGIGCIDFASLYPSCIRVLNISPETYVGKLLVYRKDVAGNISVNVKDEVRFDPYGDFEGEDFTERLRYDDPSIDHLEVQLPGTAGKRKVITIDQLRKLLDEKCIFTPNNTLFLKHEVKDGVIAKWCEHFYNKRKSIKKRMLKRLHVLQDPKQKSALTADQIREYETEAENFEVAQLGVKCMINSIYGMCGTSFSPIANPNIAQSITRMGRMANMSTAEYVKRVFMKRYGAASDYKICASGDTDSIFLNLKCVTDWMRTERKLPQAISDWKQEDRNLLWKTMSEFIDGDVNAFVRGLAHNYCRTNNQNVLTYELEYMSDVGIYERKKMYATRKIFNEGDPVLKIKYAGIQLKKGTVPKQMKKFLQDVYEGVICHNWKESDYEDYVNALYDKFKSFSVDEIAFWKGYNTERTASGFLQMASTTNPLTGKRIGATGISKSCVYYNQIIEKLGLGKRYDSLRIGDKVRMLYIDENNPYRINCIAYKDGQWPEEFNGLFKPDYKVMFQKVILDPLKSFREACHFSDIDPTKQVAFDIFTL